DVVFLDEIWKAGPSIQNALLTVLNEKRFRNGRNEEELPLKAVIAASNELPAEGEGLEALWDRFVVRLVVPPVVGKEAFRAMICGQTHLATEVDEELQISNEEYRQWSQAIDGVEVDEEVLTLIDALRDEFWPKSEEEDTIENFISDRRWKKLIRLARTAAFLEGRERVLTEDCMLFACGLWNNDTHRIERTERTERMVAAAIFRPLYNRLEEFKQTHKRIVEQMLTTAKLKGISLSRYRLIDYKYYNIVGFSEGQTLIPKELFESLSQRIATLLTLTPYDEEGNTMLSKEVTQPRPRRVSLLRSVNGVRIDGVEYPLELAADDNVGHYFPKEYAALQELEEQLDRFHEEVLARVRELTSEKSRPLFMSSEQLQRLRSEGNRVKLQTKKFKNQLYSLQ
ncbi:MAG: AAA family ATPase, partial [Alistipes sp.]|nr:AAA family ATPase [Alistipes sp.]